MTLAEHLVGPLTFDVTPNGTLYIGQDFAGLLTKVSGGASETLATGPAIAAVSILGDVVTWGEREGDMEQVFASRLMQRAADGTVTSIDVLAWEQANNPDASAEYGFRDLAPDCLAQIPPFLLPFVGPHGGAIDTHVYGSLMLKDVTYVADAGANAVLAVDAAGDISTVAVLPPSSLVATDGTRRGVRPARVRRRSRLRHRAGADRRRAGQRRLALRHLAPGGPRGREPRCARRRVPREPDDG